jgi:hypothetical protein
MASFNGLTQADFDAYLEPKWGSNRFNLERMKAREKLQALATQAAAASSLAGLDLGQEATHDHPTIFNHKRVDAQWVFFSRPESERKRLGLVIDKEHPLHRRIEDPAPHHHHVVLSLRLDTAGLEVGMRVHENAWLDVRNLSARCERPEDRAELLRLLGALPDAVACLGGANAPASEVTEGQVAEAASALGHGQEWLSITRSFERTDPILATGDLVPAAADLLDRLLPVYRFTAWSESNDHVGLAERMIAERRRAEDERKKNAPKPIEEGARVQILRGTFKGHTGEVESLDGMGGASIRLGTLSLHMMLRDLQQG